MRFPITITSDGTTEGTSVVDADGESVGKIANVQWQQGMHFSYRFNSTCRCIILMDAPKLDNMIAGADDEWHVDRMGKPVLMEES